MVDGPKHRSQLVKCVWWPKTPVVKHRLDGTQCPSFWLIQATSNGFLAALIHIHLVLNSISLNEWFRFQVNTHNKQFPSSFIKLIIIFFECKLILALIEVASLRLDYDFLCFTIYAINVSSPLTTRFKNRSISLHFNKEYQVPMQ